MPSQDDADANKATRRTSKLVSVAESTQKAPAKKRGRKELEYDAYVIVVREQISNLKGVLDDETVSIEKKRQVRNQISAFQTRLRQRRMCYENQ